MGSQGTDEGLGDEARPDREPLAGRVVGWYRPDVSLRILLFLPVCILSTAGGALLVGYGYGRLDRADPIGLHADARAFEAADGAAERSVYAPRERGQGEALGTMWLLFVLGLALVACGPALTILYLRRMGARDDFLLLRTDGLIASVDGSSTSIPWDAIEAVRFDPERAAVELQMREGAPRLVEPRLVDDGEAMAKRLEEVRRKAIWNLLPQQRR